MKVEGEPCPKREEFHFATPAEAHRYLLVLVHKLAAEAGVACTPSFVQQIQAKWEDVLRTASTRIELLRQRGAAPEEELLLLWVNYRHLTVLTPYLPGVIQELSVVAEQASPSSWSRRRALEIVSGMYADVVQIGACAGKETVADEEALLKLLLRKLADGSLQPTPEMFEETARELFPDVERQNRVLASLDTFMGLLFPPGDEGKGNDWESM